MLRFSGIASARVIIALAVVGALVGIAPAAQAADTTGPVFDPYTPIDASSPDDRPVKVNYLLPTATDPSGLNGPVVCTPAPNSLFPVGSTITTCTATDTVGNSTNLTFSIEVMEGNGEGSDEYDPDDDGSEDEEDGEAPSNTGGSGGTQPGQRPPSGIGGPQVIGVSAGPSDPKGPKLSVTVLKRNRAQLLRSGIGVSTKCSKTCVITFTARARVRVPGSRPARFTTVTVATGAVEYTRGAAVRTNLTLTRQGRARLKQAAPLEAVIVAAAKDEAMRRTTWRITARV